MCLRLERFVHEYRSVSLKWCATVQFAVTQPRTSHRRLSEPASNPVFLFFHTVITLDSSNPPPYRITVQDRCVCELPARERQVQGARQGRHLQLRHGEPLHPHVPGMHARTRMSTHTYYVFCSIGALRLSHYTMCPTPV